MEIDYFFSVGRSDEKLWQRPVDFALSRASSMGPCLAAYAARHIPGGRKSRYCLSRADWNGFIQALESQRPLLQALGDCVLSVFDHDPDMPDEVRDPGPEDWKRLAAFEGWFDAIFQGRFGRASSQPFSISPEHFQSRVEWAFALLKWLELDALVQEALSDPLRSVYLDIG